MSLFPDDLDPSAPRQNPVQLPYAKSERVRGGMIHCYSLAERDAIPREWREEGTTIAFVDGVFPGGEPPVPEGGWRGQPNPADPEAPLPDPDEREAKPAAPGQHYRLQNGITNDCWVPFGGGGEGTYTGTVYAAVNGAYVGMEFVNAPYSFVFDTMFSLAFTAGATITNIAGNGGAFGIKAHGGNWIFEKGVTVTVTGVTGSYSVVAGTINARSLEANGVVLDPGPTTNAWTVADGPRSVATTYVAKMTATNTASGVASARSSAPRTLTPYAPCYYRVVTSSSPGEATMKGGVKFLEGPQAVIVLMFSSNAAAGERAGASFPLSLGGVSKITDEGGANVYFDRNTDPANNAFNRTLGSYTLLDGTLEPMENFALRTAAGNGSSFTYKFWF
ncbi:MAG TPA: hypothetical protein VEI97_02195 [bacterium]|nr:hypothetical protein [bacterium]